MKKLKDYILEGISYKDEFIFNFEIDGENDIIKLKNTTLKKSSIGDNVFLFQYNFETTANSSIRKKFFDYFRFDNIFDSTNEKRLFLNFALDNLYSNININEFDAIVYPKSRSNINELIIKQITSYNKISTNIFELIKELPQNITFDFDRFENEILNSQHLFHGKVLPKYNEKQKQIELDKIKIMVDEIRKSDYFSIANSVKGNKYKEFFSDFLLFKDQKSKQIFSQLSSGNILIIDDVTTTGSTIKEIIKIIRKINPKHKIVIFSIVGKDDIL